MKPSSIRGDVFYGTSSPPEETATTWAAHLWRNALVLFSIGFLGTIAFAASLPTQLVVGAPVFEEMWKLGTTLLLVHALRLRSGPARVLVALVSGALFGVLEHHLTYAAEPAALYAGRALFHSGACALSMAVWHAVSAAPEPGLRWLATAPATVVHWANNFSALVLLVPSLFFEDASLVVALVVAGAATLAAHAGAWVALARPESARRLIARLWRAIPAELRR